MDQSTLMALGNYLNDNLRMDTCDNSLKYTNSWLELNDLDHMKADLDWLESQGITCDCDVVIKLYLPAKAKDS